MGVSLGAANRTTVAALLTVAVANRSPPRPRRERKLTVEGTAVA